jgi:methylaspartate ammonia-lyase
VEFEKMQQAVNALSENILRLQGDGDYEAVVGFIDTYGTLGPTLQQDLDRLGKAGIPVDVVFEQGL